jgi:hypothetical protein
VKLQGNTLTLPNQALMQARKLEASTPYNLEIQNFMANRLWALSQITWGEVLKWTSQPTLPASGARRPAPPCGGALPRTPPLHKTPVLARQLCAWPKMGG